MSDDLTRSFNGSTDDKLNRIISLVQSLDLRLTNVEEKVDTRLRETQPIWERVLAEIAELRTGQSQFLTALDQLRGGQDQLRSALDELRKDTRLGLHKVERQIMQLSKEFLEIRADNVMLEDRIEKLEGDNV